MGILASCAEAWGFSSSQREFVFMDLILLRLLFVALLGGVCYFLHPFGLTGWVSAGVGAGAAGAVIIFELRVRALSLRRLIGAVFGSVLRSEEDTSELQS